MVDEANRSFSNALVPESGELLAERYRIGEKLGAGGMGVVFAARDERLGRDVAVKVLPPTEKEGVQARERLIREARAAAKLAHPGIVQVFDAGETTDGRAYVVMEKVAGKTLRTCVPVDTKLAGRIVREVASALATAHDQGLVHRDIKPDNLMLRDDGRVAVLDFGLVKTITKPLGPEPPDTPTLKTLTESGAIVGTAAYLAPEQARGKASPATDQWALAVVAYELLTGRLPWDGQDSTFILAQILMDDPPKPSSISGLPPTVDAVFDRALSKDPAARFESIESFAHALAKAMQPGPDGPISTVELDSDHVLVPAVGAATSTISRRTRRFAPLVVLTMVGAGAAAYTLQDRPEPAAPSALALLEPGDPVVCPLFEASGTEPSGWLGAAAAISVCQRVNILLGWHPDTMRTPPDLLELPPLPEADFPHEPYEADDARERTIREARNANVWIDGRVERRSDGVFEIMLRLTTHDGVAAEVAARGQPLYQVAEDAARALVATEHVRGATQLDAEATQWSQLSNVEHALLVESMLSAAFDGASAPAWCERVYEELPEQRAAAWDGDCASYVDPPEFDVEIDRASPARLALSAYAYAEQSAGEDLTGLADELAQARRTEESRLGVNVLKTAEGFLRMFDGDTDAGRALMRSSVQNDPHQWGSRVFFMRAEQDADAAVAMADSMRAWHPQFAEAWVAGLRLEDELRYIERARILAPRQPRYALEYAWRLIGAERLEEARSIASDLRVEDDTKLAGLLVDSWVDLRQGRFLEAERKAYEALEARRRPFGVVVNGDLTAIRTILRHMDRSGRTQEADQIVQELLLSDDARIDRNESFWEIPLVAVCARASSEVAIAGLDRIEALLESHGGRDRKVGAEDFAQGARALAAGDAEGAVASWRPLVRNPNYSVYLPVDVFDHVGETELARHLDAPYLEDTRIAGAHPSNVREARRCAAEGNVECARSHAQRIIDAWATTDVDLPEVDEMRTLLTTL